MLRHASPNQRVAAREKGTSPAPAAHKLASAYLQRLTLCLKRIDFPVGDLELAIK